MRIGIDARKLADFGIGTYIRGLLRGLAELGGGNERSEPDNQYVVFAPPAARELVPERFEHVPLEAPHYSLRELLVVGRAAERAGLDLFHAPHYVVPVTRVPLVVTIHDLIHLHQPQTNPFAPLYAKTMLRRAVRRARRVLTVSEAVASELRTELGARDVTVTPDGVDHDVFHPDGPREEGRYFLFAGNDKPHKNVARLVEAFTRLRGSRTQPGAQDSTRLILAGSDFASYSKVKGVIAAGFLETPHELAALMRGAIAVVVPSLEEGFGLPAAEAMACGAPVMTSMNAALVEVTGDAALHVDATSVDALAAAMQRLHEDEALRATLAARGVERARSLTWRRCAELTRAVYRSVADR
jgi:glycosyltransferase involved in cell wall biosynthesis